MDPAGDTAHRLQAYSLNIYYSPKPGMSGLKPAGLIRIPLDTEVGLGPGDILLDGGDLAPPRKGAQHPRHFLSACVYCGETVAHLSNC